MSFVSGQFGPEALIDAAGNALPSATVVAPAGYTVALDARGNLTVTGPAADSVPLAVTVNGTTTTVPVRVLPLVTELASVAAVSAEASARAVAVSDAVTTLVGGAASDSDTLGEIATTVGALALTSQDFVASLTSRRISAQQTPPANPQPGDLWLKLT